MDSRSSTDKSKVLEFLDAPFATSTISSRLNSVGRARRGGYIIDWWIGDHEPKHVHVYRDGRLVCKVDVPSLLVLSGRTNARILSILRDLQKEGVL